MNSILSAIRAARTPVALAVDSGFAERMATETNITTFDIHEDLDILLSKMDSSFMTNVYKDVGKNIDFYLKVKILAAARALPKVDRVTIDSIAGVTNALNEVWGSEVNNDDNGYSEGNLHVVTAYLNVYERWQEYAGNVDANPDALLTTTKKQEVNSNFRDNTQLDILESAGILGNEAKRSSFMNGINQMLEMEQQVQVIKELASKERKELVTDAQVAIICNVPVVTTKVITSVDADGVITKRVADRTDLSLTEEAVIRFKDAEAQLANTDADVFDALGAYEEDINDQKRVLQNFYESELALTSACGMVLDYCRTKMLEPGETGFEFHNLPASVQIGACTAAIQSLERTITRFKSKGSIYRHYKKAVGAACELLIRVIDARHEG